MVLTTMGGYALAPSAASSFDWLGLGVVSVGTAFCVASANSFNQWIEVPYDAQMKRTCDRPLVRGDMSPLHAFAVAVASGAVGVGILSTINRTVAALGLGNIFLYAAIYTPMKRLSIANTVRHFFFLGGGVFSIEGACVQERGQERSRERGRERGRSRG